MLACTMKKPSLPFTPHWNVLKQEGMPGWLMLLAWQPLALAYPAGPSLTWLALPSP